MGFGRVHGAGNNSTRSELRRWLLRSGVGHRTARRLSCSEPTIRSCGKTLERGRPGSSGTAQRSPKTALNQSALHMTRQQLLKRLRDPDGTPVLLQPAKVHVAYDPARLRGSPQAPVMIVEFSDFQCPF